MDTTPPVFTLKRSSDTEILTTILNEASVNEFPFALWRLPNTTVKNLIISNQYQKLTEKPVIEELNTGFIFAPFDKKKEKIFLPADYFFRFENGQLKPPSTPLEISSNTWLENFKPAKDGINYKIASYNKQLSFQSVPLDYIELVRSGIAEIQNGSFEKVVPSRTKHVPLPDDFDIVKAFEKLCSAYPHALVSFVNIPSVGTWLGATPEVLVSVEDKTIFRTVALAGTQRYKEGMNLKSIAWTQKDIEEQALVELYIISCFKKIRLREYEEHGPKTSIAGNLIHLKSDFMVDMKATNFPQLGSIMLDLLHPTSAVCGMPLQPATDFIKQREGYDRSFYAGYLGPVNIDSNINIFVNLRCMQIFKTDAILYAGAGVTIDSIPELELEETEMKFNTLLNVVFQDAISSH
ncbi:chorismate-binding protein [Chryseosolibacter indicus]|uniref:Chorismate-binding protein n=1 Tax=Chryseosolibacter indicus TaxID=2782351 RepID=A0ABS5VRD2_9BACT|nr:chorismate-binding protein [Chryseosolibacter indicus]MBT1702571.1 chorismate-binding protein [Chryseosolibacter indicus]